MKIMLADDEPSIHSIVKRVARDNGFAFSGVFGGLEVAATLAQEQPDLLILDVMMPDMDGFTVCRNLREQGVLIPIIFLSARGDIVDKGVGFAAGGDDYLVKPFSPRELAMRVEAHIRRQQRTIPKLASTIEFGDIVVDLKRYRVTVKGEPVEFTQKEYKLLILLMSHPGEVFTHTQLTEEVWGKDFVSETSSIPVFIRKIREKIEDDPSQPEYLQTVWRTGYRFGD
jgi:DNA-binding response OmpR family regulator